MVSALGRGGIGDADPLDGTWIVSRDRLPLDHRDAGLAVGLADRNRTVPEDAAEGCAGADLFEEA